MKHDNLRPSQEKLLAMYERMILIRETEEYLGAQFRAGELPAGVHLYVGQEASAVGVCAHLGDDDWITSTHRGHGHFLAKGGDPYAMIAEIHAKADGVCGGFGGTMHVADISRGILGANGIVGGGLAIATGAAFAAKLERKGKVAVCFFGDGAANQGTLMEAMNVASLWKLPLLLVCEHNGWSEFTRSEVATSGNILDRAKPFGIPAHEVDGNDVSAVWCVAGEMLEAMRAGGGPGLLVTHTYRTRGHVEAEINFLSQPYRSDEEVASWVARDPLDRAAALLIDIGSTADEIVEIRKRVRAAVDEASARARSAPDPDPKLVKSMMFSEVDAW
ncbi:thiamine pyrophosphate-dependent dehydrogenase E1 component subunit alpha [Sphingorhabdus lacus]|nr:thiamine pyrophosphate-dependent dehydrogenase E1 component subunit alpha [Sphingorhabdus lacus]